MISLGLGSTISLNLSLVILRSNRSYIFLPSISFSWRRHPLVSEARCSGMLCFWASKVKGRSCTTRALLLWVSEVCLWAELWVLQTGRLVSRSSCELVSCSGSQWHQIHSKHKLDFGWLQVFFFEVCVLAFASISPGLKVNYEKTEAVRIGAYKSSNLTFPSSKPITWANETVFALGVWFSTFEDKSALNSN